MLGAGSWPSMVLSRANTANHHPVLNLQMFSGEATWVAVLEGRNHFTDKPIPLVMLVSWLTRPPRLLQAA
jgi:hypothetical protein